MEQMLSNIAAVITITLTLGGVVLLLLVIHFLSIYFKPGNDSSRLQDDLRALRSEVSEKSGVSRHSLFYCFFFRDN